MQLVLAFFGDYIRVAVDIESLNFLLANYRHISDHLIGVRESLGRFRADFLNWIN